MKANIEIQYNNQFHEHDTRHSRHLRKIKTRNIWGEKSIKTDVYKNTMKYTLI